jgi:predicted RNA polymerase sigma factor
LNLAALLEGLERSDEARSTLEAALSLPMDEEQERAIREAIQSLQ